MSAAIVEVKDDETFSYYQGYIKDLRDGKLLVHFENGWKPDEWVVPTKVRMSVPQHNADTFNPQIGDAIEAKAKSHEDEPFSWWRATLKGIKAGFYLINYSDWDETNNQFVEKEFLRPHNANPHLKADDLVRVELDIPKDLWEETDDEKTDPTLQMQKQRAYANLQQTSGSLYVIEDAGKHVLVICGAKLAVDRARMLVTITFKHQKQMRQLYREKVEKASRLEEEKKRVASGHIERFHVDKELIKFVIGKKGANIRSAEQVPGVESVRVSSDDGIIVVVGKDRECALKARLLLEFVEEKFTVPRAKFGRIVGKNFESLREIERATKVIRISAPPRPDSAGGAERKKDGDEKPRRQQRWGDRSERPQRQQEEGNIELTILGTKEAVANARLMLTEHVRALDEMALLEEDNRNISRALKEHETAFGTVRKGAGGSEEQSGPPAAGNGPAGGKRKNNRNKRANGANANGANDENKDSEAKVASEPAAPAEDGAAAAGVPKPRRNNKRERKPKGDGRVDGAAASSDAPAVNGDAPNGHA